MNCLAGQSSMSNQRVFCTLHAVFKETVVPLEIHLSLFMILVLESRSSFCYSYLSADILGELSHTVLVVLSAMYNEYQESEFL